jgi:hypothetical protein
MEVHVATVPTKVRGHGLARHHAEHDAARGLVLVTSAGGPPTLWHRAQNIVAAAFHQALGPADPDATESQLRRAYGAARNALVRFRDVLVGTSLPEVMILAMLVGPTRVGLVVGGAGRVYHHQGRQHRRLTAFEDLGGGLFGNPEPWIASAPTRPGDLLIAGSLEAFELPAIGAMAARLNVEPGAAANVLTDLLLQTPQETGVGGAAAVVRV